MTQDTENTTLAFHHHPRRWRDYRYVYPVISRRSKGLSIGINLNPGKNCTFDCIYCQINRLQPGIAEDIDFPRLTAELTEMLNSWTQIFDEERYRELPSDFRTIRDLAFSGDGEPTLSPAFPAAAGLVAELRTRHELHHAKIVVLTNSCNLRNPFVIQTLAFLDNHNGEIWAKFDAGTQAYFELINRSGYDLDEIHNSLLLTSRVRPIVIQSMFLALDGTTPVRSEIDAYLKRLRALVDNGGRIKLVQVYTVARKPAVRQVDKLSFDELETIARGVRGLGIPAEVYV